MKPIEGWATLSNGKIVCLELELGAYGLMAYPLGIFQTESEAREYFGNDAELVQVSTIVKGAE